mgnify:CR=1 FL=1
MMLRSVPFDTVAALMTAHFVSRQIVPPSRRVGIGERSETAGYQLSQRADYIHAILGLQTTFDALSSTRATNPTAHPIIVACT